MFFLQSADLNFFKLFSCLFFQFNNLLSKVILCVLLKFSFSSQIIHCSFFFFNFYFDCFLNDREKKKQFEASSVITCCPGSYSLSLSLMAFLFFSFLSEEQKHHRHHHYYQNLALRIALFVHWFIGFHNVHP